MVSSPIFEDEEVAALPLDVLQTHVIPRLDGASLAATGCASSEFRKLAGDEDLWERICIATWPSVSDARIRSAISNFQNGYRSFFSDAYPPIPRRCTGKERKLPLPDCKTANLIAAIDVYHSSVPIFLRVVEITVDEGELTCSPFRVDLMDSKYHVYATGKETGTWREELEKEVSLSWILIDVQRGRAVNLSSRRPVTSQSHWLTGDMQLKFAMVIPGQKAKEWVECGAVITLCGGKDGGDVEVREAYVGMENIEGGAVSGKVGLAILRAAMKGARRMRRGCEEDVKEMYVEFLERRQEWRLNSMRKGKAIDTTLMLVGTVVVLLFWLWLFNFF